jgi:hypothetical protein
MQIPQLSASAGCIVNMSVAGRFSNHRPRNIKFKSLPFAGLVSEYFQKYPNQYLEINCGLRAYRQSELSAYQLRVFGGKPSLHLPHLSDFREFWWPVKNLTIVLYWAYDDATLLQIEFCNHLAKVCGANCVWTSVEGEATKFADLRRCMR